MKFTVETLRLMGKVEIGTIVDAEQLVIDLGLEGLATPKDVMEAIQENEKVIAKCVELNTETLLRSFVLKSILRREHPDLK